MRWRRGAGTGQIEDRRGRGMGGPVGMAGGGIGIVGLIAVVLVSLLGGGGGGGGFDVGPSLDAFGRMTDEATSAAISPDDDLSQFIAFVVDDVQDSWQQAFASAGRRYEPTTLVLFEQATPTGCGTGSSATGPFYCPADGKVYVDLGFFRELRARFGAPGDFAQAYVIAHEFGHHVQNVLGISDDVRRRQQRSPRDANELSIMLELQADCLAGVWGYTAAEEGLLEPGDLEEGIDAAGAVGDDRIQREAGGRVDPENWTHGSSQQRVEWFTRGFDTGNVDRCDTFAEGV